MACALEACDLERSTALQESWVNGASQTKKTVHSTQIQAHQEAWKQIEALYQEGLGGS